MIKTLAVAVALAGSLVCCEPPSASGLPSSTHCEGVVNQVRQALYKAAGLSRTSPSDGERIEREKVVATYNVSNGSELKAALSRVTGGDTIRLAAGDYGAVWISGVKPSGTVNIVSADGPLSARIAELDIRNSENLRFSDIDFGRPLAAGEADWTRMIDIADSARIAFDRVVVHGSLDNNPQNDGYGIWASKTDGLAITNSKFTDIGRGMVVQQIDNLLISSNNFDLIRTDGIQIAASKNVAIDGNFFREWRPVAGDHPDAIQMFNVGQPRGSENIYIANNVLLAEGDGPQGIWISDPGTEGFKNVLIKNNLLYSAGQYNGIGVNGATGVQIVGNSVFSTPTDDKRFWIRVMNSDDVDVRGNVTEDLLLSNTTNVRDTSNTVFSREPSAKGLIPNLIAPRGDTDLVTPGKGYQPHVAPDKAPLSDALGGSISSMLATANSATVSKTALAIDDGHVASNDTIHLGAFAGTGAIQTADVSPYAPPAVIARAEVWLNIEHFTALP